jgi:hypothetical protein
MRGIMLLSVGVELREGDNRLTLGARDDKRHFPVPCLRKHDLREIDPWTIRGFLNVLLACIALPNHKPDGAFSSWLEGRQIRHVGYEGRTIANYDRLVFSEDLVAIGPDCDLKGLFFVLVLGLTIGGGWIVAVSRVLGPVTTGCEGQAQAKCNHRQTASYRE